MQTEAAYKLLSDGEWHTWTELRDAMLGAIPATLAKRHAIKVGERARGYRGVKNPRRDDNDEETLIWIGRNTMVSGSLYNLTKIFQVDRQGSTEKVNWLVRIDPNRPGPKRNAERIKGGIADKEWRKKHPDIIAESRRKSSATQRQNWRNKVEMLSDEEALENKKDAQKAALISRPHLWPSNPAPISSLTHVGSNIYRCGWLYYESNGEATNDEIFRIELVWPVKETIIYTTDTLSMMVIRHFWRILLPK